MSEDTPTTAGVDLCRWCGQPCGPRTRAEHDRLYRQRETTWRER